MSKTTNKYSPEVRERAVRLVFDNEGQHGSRWQAILSIAAKIGCAPQTLNDWVKKAEVNGGKRSGVVRSERASLQFSNDINYSAIQCGSSTNYGIQCAISVTLRHNP